MSSLLMVLITLFEIMQKQPQGNRISVLFKSTSTLQILYRHAKILKEIDNADGKLKCGNQSDVIIISKSKEKFMPEVLEIEEIETEETQIAKPKWDSWAVKIPQEIIEAQGLAEDSLAVLTVSNGKIEGEISSLSPQLKEISKRILEKNREVYEELKRLGD